jgi:hypothetical protein
MTRVGYRQSDFPGLGVVRFQCCRKPRGDCNENERDNRTSNQTGSFGNASMGHAGISVAE